MTDTLDRKKLVSHWNDVVEFIDEKDLKKLIESADWYARANMFLQRMRESKSPPTKYGDTPRPRNLIQFIRREWYDKGHLPNTIDRSLLGAYDNMLLSAIRGREVAYKHLPIPPELNFPRTGNAPAGLKCGPEPYIPPRRHR